MKFMIYLFLAISLAVILPAAIPTAAGEDANYWLSQTQSDYRNGSYSLALQDIDEYLDLKPGDTWAWSFKANVLIKLKRYSEAVDSFDQLISLDASNAQAYNDRALVLSGGMRQNDEAIASIEKALQINPNDANYWYNKGLILENAKEYDDALSSYGQAVKFDSSLENAWLRQGLVLQAQGKYNESISTLDQALSLNSQDAAAWNAKGMALMEQNSRALAESCFKKATDIDPANREYQMNLKNSQEEMSPQPDRMVKFNSTE